MSTRDKVAEAICSATTSGEMFPWETLRDSEKDAWRRMADAAISAINDEVSS